MMIMSDECNWLELHKTTQTSPPPLPPNFLGLVLTRKHIIFVCFFSGNKRRAFFFFSRSNPAFCGCIHLTIQAEIPLLVVDPPSFTFIDMQKGPFKDQ